MGYFPGYEYLPGCAGIYPVQGISLDFARGPGWRVTALTAHRVRRCTPPPGYPLLPSLCARVTRTVRLAISPAYCVAR